MKTKIISGVIFLCLISMVVFYKTYQGDRKYRILKNPQPIDLNRKFGEKKEFKKQRKHWIENMHRTAPGVDWRVMDRKTRYEKNITKLSKRNAMFAKKQLHRQGTVEQFANGMLGGSWIEKGSSNLSGRMHTTEVDFENNLIYAGSAGGNVWVTDLEGKSWHSINDYLQLDDINMVRRIPHNDGFRLIVVSMDRVAYTDNDGLTWNYGSGYGGYIIQGVMANDAQNSVFLLTDEWSNEDSRNVTNIYISNNLGKSFSKAGTFYDSGAYYYHIWTSRYENTKVFVLKKDELYTLSNKSSLEFVSKVNVNFPTQFIENVSITGSKDASYIYITYFVQGKSMIYRSADSGKTWSKQGTLEDGIFTKRSFCCSLENPDLVYLGGIDAHRSTTGGTEWDAINSWGQYYGDPETKLHADIPEIIPFINNEGKEVLYFSTDGGLYVSKDDGQTVKNISLDGLRISQYYSTYSYRKDDTDFIYAGSQDQGFQRSTWETGGLVEFEQLITGDYGQLVSGDGGVSLWGNYPGFVFYCPDITRSNDSYWWDFAGFYNHLWMPPMCQHPTDPRKVYVGAGTSTSGSHLWCLTFFNNSFYVEEGDYNFSNAQITAIGYAPRDINYLYVLTEGGKFYTSSDNGKSWTRTSSFTGPEGHYFYGASIVGSPTVKGRVYIAGSGYSNPSVYVSDDYGETFRPMSEGLPSTLVFDIDINPEGDLLFAATEVGPYAYLDSLDKWVDIAGIYAPDQTYWTVEYIPHLKTARFGTYGRGIWDFNVENWNTAIEQEKNSQIPRDYHLSNYPNPFNSDTRISYSIPNSGWIELTIYNSMGQKIRTLINEYKTSGNHTISWDGRDENGQIVASGMYLSQLKSQSDNSLHTNKMMFVK